MIEPDKLKRWDAQDRYFDTYQAVRDREKNGIPGGADPIWQPAWIKPDCDISKGIFGYNLRVPIEELRHWLDLGKNY